MTATPAASAANRRRVFGEVLRLPGGALCLDFCNTGYAMRDGRGIEGLPEFTDLVDWLEAAGAMSQAQARRLRRAAQAAPGAAADILKRAIFLRETLFRVFDAAARGESAARADLDHVAATYAAALASSGFEWSHNRYAWRRDASTTSLPAVLHPIIGSAVELMASEKLEQLRRCGSATCYWLFLDETRNHSRRWCEMATCGNLAKVRRHRQKGRTAHAA